MDPKFKCNKEQQLEVSLYYQEETKWKWEHKTLQLFIGFVALTDFKVLLQIS